MKQKYIITLIMIVCISLSSCSFFVSSTEMVTVSTSEKDADIYINGTFVGKGAGEATVKKNKDVFIRAEKEGYLTATRGIQKKLSGAGIADVIGGYLLLVPLFGLLAPGAWELESSHMYITMSKKESA